MRASDVMQKSVVSVSEELSIQDFEELLAAEEISGAPVTTGDGRLVGIASKTDVVRALAEQMSDQLRDLGGPDITVGEIMTRDVVSVGPDADVRQIARTMIDGQLHRVLVVDRGQVVGILTAFDLLRALLEEV